MAPWVRGAGDPTRIQGREPVSFRGGRNDASVRPEVIEQLGGQQVRREMVDLEGVLDAPVGETRFRDDPAGVIQEDVETVGRRPDGRGEIPHGLAVSEIRGEKSCLGTDSAEFVDDPSAGVRVATVDDHVGSEPAERERTRPPDAARRTGEEYLDT